MLAEPQIKITVIIQCRVRPPRGVLYRSLSSLAYCEQSLFQKRDQGKILPLLIACLTDLISQAPIGVHLVTHFVRMCRWSSSDCQPPISQRRLPTIGSQARSPRKTVLSVKGYRYKNKSTTMTYHWCKVERNWRVGDSRQL